MLGPDIFNKSILKLKRSDGVLTRTEIEALILLEKITNPATCRIFTQVHLLQIIDIGQKIIENTLNLNHVLKGRRERETYKLTEYWRHQLGHKSVDFLVCSKDTTNVCFGIEIDGHSHANPKQQEWDDIKDRCFKMAKIPLVRFLNKEISNVKGYVKTEDFKDLLKERIKESMIAIVDFHEEK